ncbi:aldehyde dehydrogenase family protein [Janibacter alittae]|uniref:Aldehyde dehydrogenase family protein n=1 Tax=Janibacter alittae TaxID=3115209 RepID=A0ABZ2MG60_9MICO
MSDVTPFWIAGTPAHGQQPLEVTHPLDGTSVGRTTYAEPEQVEAAVDAAHSARHQTAALPVHVRSGALDQVARRIIARSEELARLITAENGKPIRWARAEVSRAAAVFRLAGENARTWSGEVQRLDTESAAEGRLAYTVRVPRGPVLAITPFNFPLNLVAHKVAPAIAVGAPVVIKPAPKTPLSALLLGELLAQTSLPPGAVSVINVPDDTAPDLVADPRLPVVSFTGSGPVGASIRAAVPQKHVTLELGGNAAVVVCADWSDISCAADRIATFANYQGGQSCVGVQRVYVERSRLHELRSAIVAAVESLGVGDPADEATHVGPLITVEAAQRVESWVQEAVDAGARVLTGGRRDGSTYAPTVLEDVPVDAKVSCEEVFGPVLLIHPVDSVDEALALVNDSRYGLQAGVFTHDLRTAFRAHRELEVGGVVIGDVPSYRADQMPYGGTKDSGEGREGVRYAMSDFTYDRVMVLTGLPL